MQASGGGREVEYEPIDPPGIPDEELQVAPSPRLRWLCAVLCVCAALLATAALARFLGEPGRPAAQDAVPYPRVPPVEMGALVALHSSPMVCPPTIECTRKASLPRPFIDAMADHLPNAVTRDPLAVTQTNPPRVYFRRLAASVGDVIFSVQVTRSDILDGLASTSREWSWADLSWRFVRVVTPDGYEVVVEAYGPSSRIASIATLRALAADPRLLALS